MTVYADNAATTKMSQTALNAMLPAMEENFGNPSSLHSVGQRAAELLMKSRETVARCLNCQPREIIFTSGGSEADNQALLSAAAIGRRKGKMHIISMLQVPQYSAPFSAESPALECEAPTREVLQRSRG